MEEMPAPRPWARRVVAAVRARHLWRRPAVLVGVICAASFTASLVLQATLYRHGSGDADEAAYVLQARMLLRGRLTLDAASMEPFFRPWLTGEHGGRLFTKYLPGWPALLATSQALTATMVFAPALVAVGWVAGTYRLARELLDDVTTAVVAAVGVALCPLVAVHTALPLAYGCCAAVVTLTAAALLRGARTGGRGSLLGAGVGAGFALLLRPFDVVLVLAPVVVFALWRLRLRLRLRPRDGFGLWGEAAGRSSMAAVVARRGGWVLVGAAPFVAVLLAYCWWVTGSPLRMPLSASDPLDRFGFGARRILPTEPTFAFGRRLALRAAGQTLRAAPGWLFGGMVLVALAVLGAVGSRRRRGERLLLVAMVAAVLGGYLFWWGSAMAMPGLRDGLGPHYHLAALSPLVILAAAGARQLWSAAGALSRPSGVLNGRVPVARGTRVVVAGGLVAVMVAFTVTSLPGKVRVQRDVNDRNALVAALLPASYPDPSVVVVTPDLPSRYTQVPYQTLRNGPDLHGRVLYAADLGAATATLPDRVPGRALFRLRPGEIIDPAAARSYHGTFTRLAAVDGARVRLRIDVHPPAGMISQLRTAQVAVQNPQRGGSTGGPMLYVRVGTWVRTFPLPATGPPTTLVLTSGTGTGTGAGAADEISLASVRLPGEVVVGLSVPTADGPARWEERIPVARRGPAGELTLLTPGLGWRWVPARAQDGWLPATIRPVLSTTASRLP